MLPFRLLFCNRFPFLSDLTLKNVHGFSVIGVMVAAGMMGGLSLAVSHIIKQINDGKRETQHVQDQFRVQREISLLLANRNHCTMSLHKIKDANNMDVTTRFEKLNVDEFHEAFDVELYTSDQAGNARSARVFYPGKKIGKWTLTWLRMMLDASTGNHTPNQTNEDTGDIIVAITKRVDGKDFTKNIKFPIKVKVTTGPLPGPESTLTECQSEDTAGLGPPSSLTETPTGLAVSGSVQIGGAGALACSSGTQGSVRFIDVSGSKRMEYCNGSRWLIIGLPSSLTGSSSGIEIDGSTKVGTVSSPCTASNKGTIRYNDTTNKIEFCNSSSWTVLGSSAQHHTAGRDCFPHFGQANAQNPSCPTGYTLSYPRPHLHRPSMLLLQRNITDVHRTVIMNLPLTPCTIDNNHQGINSYPIVGTSAMETIRHSNSCDIFSIGLNPATTAVSANTEIIGGWATQKVRFGFCCR